MLHGVRAPTIPFDAAREAAELRDYLGEAYEQARLERYEEQLEAELEEAEAEAGIEREETDEAKAEAGGGDVVPEPSAQGSGESMDSAEKSAQDN